MGSTSDFLCTPVSSRAAVMAPAMFHNDTGTSDGQLRASDNFHLVTALGCRDCHARLENAVRAFRGFTVGSLGLRFVSAQAFDGTVDFYVRDSGDRRATGPATPAWVGKTIAAQPEFGKCMVQKVEEIVYGG